MNRRIREDIKNERFLNRTVGFKEIIVDVLGCAFISACILSISFL